MSSDQSMESLTESESQRFADKLQVWGMTLEPKEQQALAAVLWCASRAGAPGGDQDVAGYYVQSRGRAFLGTGGQNQLSAFAIQNMMSAFNEAQTLATSVQKKYDDTNSGIIGTI